MGRASQDKHGSKLPRDDGQQRQSKPLGRLEQQDAGTGNQQQDQKQSVGTDVAEIVQVIVAFPKGINHQKRQKSKQQRCNDALLPREQRCAEGSIGVYPWHRQTQVSKIVHIPAIHHRRQLGVVH